MGIHSQPGRFELTTRRDIGGVYYHYCLIAGNGRTLMKSNVFDSKQGAFKSIESVMKNAALGVVVEKEKDRLI